MKERIRNRKIGFLFFFGLLFLNCGVPTLLSDSNLDSEAVAREKATIIARMTITAENTLETPLAVNEGTITALPDVQCAYAWAYKQDDDLTAQFQAVVPSAMRSLIQIGVSWYGENCLSVGTNEIVQFVPKDLEITVSYLEHDVQSDIWMGEQIDQITRLLIRELENHPDLNPYPKNVHFIFNQTGELFYVNFPLEKFKDLGIENGLHGGELLQALRN